MLSSPIVPVVPSAEVIHKQSWPVTWYMLVYVVAPTSPVEISARGYSTDTVQGVTLLVGSTSYRAIKVNGVVLAKTDGTIFSSYTAIASRPGWG